MIQQIFYSDCCNFEPRIAHGCDDDFLHGGKSCDCEIVTSWWECKSCHKPCNVHEYHGDNENFITKFINWFKNLWLKNT